MPYYEGDFYCGESAEFAPEPEWSELDELNAADPCGDGTGTADEFEALEARDALLQLDALTCPRCGSMPAVCDCGLMRVAA